MRLKRRIRRRKKLRLILRVKEAKKGKEGNAGLGQMLRNRNFLKVQVLGMIQIGMGMEEKRSIVGNSLRPLIMKVMEESNITISVIRKRIY